MDLDFYDTKKQQQFFNQIWPKILRFVTNLLHKHPITRYEWQYLFTLVYDLYFWDCNGVEKMKESLKSEVLTLLTGIQRKIENEDIDYVKLQIYVADWEQFLTFCNDIPAVFYKLNYLNIKKYGDTVEHADYHYIIYIIRNILIESWIQVFFNDMNNNLLDIAMRCLNYERNGTQLDSQLIISLRDSYVKLFPNQNLHMYKIYFERAYFETTAMFYKQKASENFERHKIASYMDYVNDIIKIEVVYAKQYLHSSSLGKLMNCVAQALTSNYLSIILAGCPTMIRTNDFQILRKIFLIMIRVPDGLSVMLKDLEEFIVNSGLADLSASVNIKDPVKYVDTLVMLFHKYKTFLCETFNNEPKALIALDKAFKRIVNDVTVFQLENSVKQVSVPNCHLEFKCSELLANVYDILLKKTPVRNKLTAEEIESKLNDMFIVLKYIQNPEIFIKYYKVHLIRRLILDTSVDIRKDETLVIRFKDICYPVDCTSISKLAKMFHDIKYNESLNQEFQRKYTNLKGINADALTFKILNSWAWSSQLLDNDMKLTLPAELEGYKSEIERFYNHKHPGHHARKLLWSYRMSRATITFTSDVGQYNIKVTALQMIVLFVWNPRPKDKISLEDLRLATGLSDSDLRSVLWSIIALRDLQQQILLVSSKVSSQQAFNENTQFWINEKFTMFKSNGMVQKNGNINLTKKLQLTSQPIKNNNNKEHNSLVQLRATRVKEAIKKILKIRKRILYVDLKKELDVVLKNLYLPNKQIVKEQVEYLIESKFIERDLKNINMLIYINTSQKL